MNTPALTALPPLSLYVHIPWCIRKCPYCDFNSHTLNSSADENAYVDALLTDLAQELPLVWGRPVESVFFGGGTPSVFSAEAIDRLLGGIRALVRLQPGAEITLEANPGTFERERFGGYAQAGINRLSIGVQSFDDAKLAALGRIHRGGEAEAAVTAALDLFERVNTDLMYALPQQSPEQAAADIRRAAAAGVRHISAYHLTMEPNTPFGHTPPPGLPEDEAALDIEAAVHAALAEAGLAQYETSAFAHSREHQCRHNLNYWQFGDYIGIGAGAHGKISSHAGVSRSVRSRHPKDYLAAMQTQPHKAVRRHKVAADELPFEFMMNALRLHDGVPSHWFAERTGLTLAQIAPAIQKAVERGLLDPAPHSLKPTPLGRRFLNDLLQLFL
ncbi:oxygen-independent coproporphyrinogen-3 oxidase [Neisseria sp. HSC-16F19]|nr:radical SAM family heme chaperone HemW [Neisseria sp. HSC-16F19]MCP2041360.1 oxygen-independent coproporphyrinogen-3 oxidase [Neisseria sp. HSC-16F19]